MRPSSVGVGLLGYGVVGSEVDRLLQAYDEEILRRVGRRVSVVRALVRDIRKPRASHLQRGVLTVDPADVLQSPSVSIVVEAMGGLEPTRAYVRNAISLGRPVVTANKRLMATHAAELEHKARAAGVSLRFDAAVGGVAPILRILETGVPPGTVRRVCGIVNGTTNFVLTAMERGATLESALSSARQQGYTEEDATEDISGADAAAKMVLIARAAFGTSVELADAHWTGFDSNTLRMVADAGRSRMHVRLIGEAHRGHGGVSVDVRLRVIPEAHPFAQTRGVGNLVLIEGPDIGLIQLSGAGAGPPTAAAVVADIVAVVRESEPHNLRAEQRREGERN
ncbi:MAG: homoserine dehydrogenase [bacterium]